MKKIEKTLFRAVLVAAALIVIIGAWDMIGQWLVMIIGGLGSWFFAGKALDQGRVQEIRKREEELDQAAEDRRKKAEALAKEDEEQKEKVEDWRERKNRWKSRISFILICCMSLAMATSAWAGADLYADLAQEELIEMIIEAEKLLDEADQLLARETSLKEEYKRLYLEAEADFRAAKELSLQKDEIIAGQNREIELLRYQLERNNQAWGLTGGVALTGKGVQWSLGVARKKGIISFGGGVGGGDGFSLWGEVGLWVR